MPVLYGLEDLPLKIAGVAATGEQGRSSLVRSVLTVVLVILQMSQ